MRADTWIIRRCRVAAVAAALTACVFASAGVYARSEDAEQPVEQTSIRDREEAPEVSVSGLTITIQTQKPVEVSVYSLLGQLVAHTRAQVGSTRISVASHGIYIVKAGDKTFKISV